MAQVVEQAPAGAQLVHGGEGEWSGSAVTERVNEASVELDVVSPTGFLRVCRHSDAQLFSGWRSGLSVYDLLPSLEALVTVVESLLRMPAEDGEAAVVLSGSGTSGRLAFFLSRGFNQLLADQGRKPLFAYLCSGGDEALIASKESAEDDPRTGIKDLEAITEGKTRVLFIGITCGFSAGYVAGQLAHSMSLPHFTTVLLGFNPVCLARDTPIENWDSTFRQVAMRLQQAQAKDIADGVAPPRHYILNPLVGPETLTGSSRMKGGSATKFLLEVIFARAISNVCNLDLIPSPSADAPAPSKPITTEGLLFAFETTYRYTYNSIGSVKPLMVAAGNSLREGGHVYYLSSGSVSVLATVDASECPPTFGSKFTDVRAFVHNGWQTMGNRNGDLSGVGEKFRLSWTDFEKEILPSLTSTDLVLYVDIDDGQHEAIIPNIGNLLRQVQQSSATLGALLIRRRMQPDSTLNTCVKELTQLYAAVEVPYVELLPGVRAFAELAAKFALNAISTYAHVSIGKVFKNRMVDLSVSNTKLFHRSVAIVAELMGVSTDEATACILRAIYRLDDVPSEIAQRPISRHIETAASVSKVVPLALLLASAPMSITQAQERLREQPIVRKLILEASTRQ